ncbi:glycosyltransferase [Arthrobacter sp. NPDC093139]|uniref:glycosyltransferase n=1 Tax=Arthrobacter sp. NPDC093139 TaxID=3363945 RepID=UPI003808E8BC
MSTKNKNGYDALYLTVLPFYRQSCMEALLDRAPDLRIFAGPRQLTASVKTGISRDLYSPLAANFLFDRAILLRGHFRDVLGARSLMLDLNPRCITAWGILIIRRLLRRRTLVWGHLFPRAGAGAWTARLRKVMRALADGTVLYGYDSVNPAKAQLPKQPVWVAPNSLYPLKTLSLTESARPRTRVLYVGRLVAEKKVDLLVRSFGLAAGRVDGITLTIVGEGEELNSLKALASEIGCSDRVEFLGAITDQAKLKDIYSTALCSVSPGYVGLSLTQSLGFGVPMLVADDEPHAPEIELERFGGVRRFKENDETALADLISSTARGAITFPTPLEVSGAVRNNYSAESMAEGLFKSLRNHPQNLDHQGWPANDE